MKKNRYKSAMQEIMSKAKYYIDNPHKNPYDVFDYEGEEVEIINENKHYVKQTKPHIPRRF